MKNLARTLTSLLLAAIVAAPMAYADNQQTSGNRNGHHREQPAKVHRPSSDKKPAGKPSNARPSDNKHKNDKSFNHRPDHNNNGNAPAFGRPTSGNRPQPGNNGFNRPASNNRPQPGHRPDNNHGFNRPGHAVAPAPQPHRPPMVVHPPHRPHRPVPGPWSRPVRPLHWRPAPHAPSLSTMLGVAFGTAINLTINQLINGGYNVSGYNANTVYLTDVNQAGYFWPDATFYYNNGGLDRSEFFYTSPYNDNSRYANLYRAFTSRYGFPVNVVNAPLNMQATWFAPDRGYITLQYGNGASMSLPGRFVTTLTVGI